MKPISEIKYGNYRQINYVMKNGLKIQYFPYPDYHTSYVGIIIPYGLTMSNYLYNGKRFNPGVAHFLEHRMFDSENGDLFNQFMLYGANANAWTTYDKTTFYYSTSFDIIKPLKVLLDLVNDFYSPKEKIKKEKKIIIEEAKMGLSHESNILFDNLCKCIFKDSILKGNVIGKISDIKKISQEELFAAYNCFYQVKDMTLVVVGNCNINKILDMLNNYKFRESVEQDLCYSPINDSNEIASVYKKAYKDTVEPLDLIGIRLHKKELLEKNNVYQIVSMLESILDLGFSSNSSFYHEIQQEGLIDGQFQTSYFFCDDDIVVSIGFATSHYRKVINKIKRLLISPEHFISIEKYQIYQRKVVSDNIRTLCDIGSWFDEILLSQQNDYYSLEFYSKNMEILYNNIVALMKMIGSKTIVHSHITPRAVSK